MVTISSGFAQVTSEFLLTASMQLLDWMNLPHLISRSFYLLCFFKVGKVDVMSALRFTDLICDSETVTGNPQYK